MSMSSLPERRPSRSMSSRRPRWCARRRGAALRGFAKVSGAAREGKSGEDESAPFSNQEGSWTRQPPVAPSADGVAETRRDGLCWSSTAVAPAPLQPACLTSAAPEDPDWAPPSHWTAPGHTCPGWPSCRARADVYTTGVDARWHLNLRVSTSAGISERARGVDWSTGRIPPRQNSEKISADPIFPRLFFPSRFLRELVPPRLVRALGQ